MITKIFIDGKKALERDDKNSASLDDDSIVNFNKKDNDMEFPMQPSEMGEVVDKINLDESEGETRMPSIDKLSNLDAVEAEGIVAYDFLCNIGFLPKECHSASRTKKRINVSIGALGRRNIVDMIVGKKQQEEQKLRDRLMGQPKQQEGKFERN